MVIKVSMNKKIKKILIKFVPSGMIKEKLKCFYYNLNQPQYISFKLSNTNGVVHYKTKYNNLELTTTEALYPIVADFNYYQHFYKVKLGNVIMDAGANVGAISLLFSKLVGDNGVVHAFEPDKYNIKTMRENLQLNEGASENVVIHDALLWNENTMVDFEEAGTVGSSAVWFSGSNTLVKKRAVTIDSWVVENQLTQLDFIKMDIEGAEIEALEGCVETIKNLAPNFAIASYHIVNNEPTYIKVEAFFKKINYPYQTITFRKNEIITFAGSFCSNQ